MRKKKRKTICVTNYQLTTCPRKSEPQQTLCPGVGALNFHLGRDVLKNIPTPLKKWESKELIFCESKVSGNENFQHFEGLWTETWAKFRLQNWKFFKFLTNFSHRSQNWLCLLKVGNLRTETCCNWGSKEQRERLEKGVLTAGHTSITFSRECLPKLCSP